MDNVHLYIDGKPLPTKPYTPNYETQQYLREYHGLYEALGYDFDNRGVGFSRTDYANGYNMYAFDTTPDPGAKSSINIQRNRTIRIDAKSRQALTEIFK